MTENKETPRVKQLKEEIKQAEFMAKFKEGERQRQENLK